MLDPLLAFAKKTVARVLTPGAIAVDATVGNGHDTLFLARHVGDEGQVYGFDVQERAITKTRERLTVADAMGPVTLFQAGHETMDAYLSPLGEDSVAAFMFNLGYLPGSDKTCITHPDTTIEALDLAIHYVEPAGVITVVLYTGHEGGEVEAAAVEAWAKALDQTRFQVLKYQFVNRRNDPPYLLVIEKCSV